MATKRRTWRRSKLHGAIDDFGTHGGFSQVCHPENQRPAGLKAVESGSGAEVVGFAGFSADLGEGLDQLAEVGCAAAGKQALLNALAVGKQADAVAGEESELGEGYGGGAGEVELGVDARAGARQPEARTLPGVETPISAALARALRHGNA
jgi:hypothetical protein